tara:strand:+ start:801 stop:2168 length:1368 start_codon:yes stop_codon:yes gene_type:complete
LKNIVLFRNNLRVHDNPVLQQAVKSGEILPLYIYDQDCNEKKLGSASRYWLHNALDSLNSSLGNAIVFKRGNYINTLKNIVEDYSIDCVYIDKSYTPNEITLDIKIESMLFDIGRELKSINCSLLWEPSKILKSDESPYKVFTPYYKRGCLESSQPNLPVGPAGHITFINHDIKSSVSDLSLLSSSNWHKKLENHWDITEKTANLQFLDFINNKVNRYKIDRDYPSKSNNSRLSPYLRFGMIDVHRLWYELNQIPHNDGVVHYMSELGWREFSYYLLYHFPFIVNNNFQKKFDRFEWHNNSNDIESWKHGYTGFPIIDAAMKELWSTGFMHNRMRMVVASFLVKNLLVDWRIGEEWFWDCLVDADYASNIAGWQWAAGTGADAAPYFRIFNPILQGEKFDPDGAYTTKYIPQLKNIPIKHLQSPWDYNLGLEYIPPVVDYKFSRQRALLAYQHIK